MTKTSIHTNITPISPKAKRVYGKAMKALASRRGYLRLSDLLAARDAIQSFCSSPVTVYAEGRGEMICSASLLAE